MNKRISRWSRWHQKNHPSTSVPPSVTRWRQLQIRSKALYTLRGTTPHREKSLIRWAEWIETRNPALAKTQLGDTEVSTIFLGIDHAFGARSNGPVLWETAVFIGGELKEIAARYTSHKAALHGHKDTIERLRDAQQ